MGAGTASSQPPASSSPTACSARSHSSGSASRTAGVMTPPTVYGSSTSTAMIRSFCGKCSSRRPGEVEHLGEPREVRRGVLDAGQRAGVDLVDLADRARRPCRPRRARPRRRSPPARRAGPVRAAPWPRRRPGPPGAARVRFTARWPMASSASRSLPSPSTMIFMMAESRSCAGVPRTREPPPARAPRRRLPFLRPAAARGAAPDLRRSAGAPQRRRPSLYAFGSRRISCTSWRSGS